MYKTLILLLIAIIFSVTSAEDIYEKCGDQLQCVESELKGFVDRLDKAETWPIFGDFLVMEKVETEIKETGRKSDEDFFERCVRYLSTHELKFKMPQETARDLVEDARSKKLRKIILPLLILLKLKAAIIFPIILSVVALVAFKGLGAGLTALAIAGAIGFKSLLESAHGSKLTYEVVPQIASPHWSRAGFEPMMQGYHTIP